jgi:hypothetical protein
VEGDCRDIIEELFRHLSGGTEETHEKPVSSRCQARDSNRKPPERKSRAVSLHQPARWFVVEADPALESAPCVCDVSDIMLHPSSGS